MKIAKIVLLLPMMIYISAAIAWHIARYNIITGDEPHYLTIAELLIRDGDLKILNNYNPDTPVMREVPFEAGEGHAINGYSIHGIGLPLLLTPPI